MAVTVQIATKQIFWKGIPVHLSSVKKKNKKRAHAPPPPPPHTPPPPPPNGLILWRENIELFFPSCMLSEIMYFVTLWPSTSS